MRQPKSYQIEIRRNSQQKAPRREEYEGRLLLDEIIDGTALDSGRIEPFDRRRRQLGPAVNPTESGGGF